jgi:virulence-associated protein VapD
MKKILITESQFKTILEEQSNENVYKVYHGTNEKFNKFNFKKATQGIVWFTDNIDSIKKQTHGGMGNKIIMTRYITINNPAGWNEYDKYGLQQLIDMGYDGVILPGENETNYFVFSSKNIHAKPPL